MMNVSKILAAATATAVLTGSAFAQCSNYTLSPAGTVLIDLDDAIRNVALPFGFPFNGTVYTSITVSSNGWIKLGEATATSSQVTESESLMLSDDPRIAVLWDDLNPGSSGSGSLFYSADATQASVTWQGVQRFGASQTGTLANCECILLPSGEIFLNYDASCTFNMSNSQSMVGISAGYNQVPAGTSFVDWSLASPGPIAVSNATAYELFPAGTFDLGNTGVVLHFVPSGVDGYNVVQVPTLGACTPAASYPTLAQGPTVLGVGCPAPVLNSSIYELFTTDTGASPIDTANLSMLFIKNGETYTMLQGTGIDPSYTSGTVITLGDEQIANLPVGAMAVFPFADIAATSVQISSNGWIGLDGTLLVPDFSPSAAEFNNQGPRIAGCWKDHNPGIGGSVYFNDTDPNFCMVTFDAVPEYGNPGSLCTFQVKMFGNGDVQISHGAVSSVSDNVLIGISRGAALDPGSSDFVTAGVVNLIGPIDIVGANPITHTSNQLAIGKTFAMTASYTASTGIGFFIIGGSNPALPLDAVGGTNCTLYASLEFLYVQPFVGSTITQSIPIPYLPGASGAVLYSQAASFSLANPLGIVASNGLEHVVGL